MTSIKKYKVADAHCDFLALSYASGYDIGTLSNGQSINIERLRRGNVGLQYFACWIDVKNKTSPLQQTLSMIDSFYLMLQKYDRDLVSALERPSEDDTRIRCLLSIEGGEAIMGQKSNLRMFHRLGVRSMTLTWNTVNELASPAMRKYNAGLSRIGISVVKEMEALNMAVDVSHLNDQGIDDVLNLTSGPVFASHSNSRTVFAHRRSLRDEHIVEIAKRGGIIGVNFFVCQLNDTMRCSIKDIIPHIVHMAKLGGVGCVALGSDFDGMPVTPDDLRDSSEFPNLAAALLEAGFSESETADIMYNNLARFTEKLL